MPVSARQQSAAAACLRERHAVPACASPTPLCFGSGSGSGSRRSANGGHSGGGGARSAGGGPSSARYRFACSGLRVVREAVDRDLSCGGVGGVISGRSYLVHLHELLICQACQPYDGIDAEAGDLCNLVGVCMGLGLHSTSGGGGAFASSSGAKAQRCVHDLLVFASLIDPYRLSIRGLFYCLQLPA
jgi:hypothetical protein